MVRSGIGTAAGVLDDGMTESPDINTLKAFNAGIAEEFRSNGGKVGGQLAGSDLLLLTTTGAKSGQPRVSPLGYLRVDGMLLIIGAYRGADVHPSWVHNLRANPQTHIEVGTESFDVIARELPPAERGEVLSKVTAIAPWIAEYQAKTSRVIPLFELSRV
jgi:deazaflavin-dependent oxidoreductase (nitroreductase family)